MWAKEVVVGDEECGGRHGAVASGEATGGADVVRVGVVEVFAGLNLWFVPSQNLVQLLDQIAQVLTGKFPAEPNDQMSYLVYGCEPLGNLASSFRGDFAERDFNAFFSLRSKSNPPHHAVFHACKNHPSTAPAGGKQAQILARPRDSEIYRVRKEKSLTEGTNVIGGDPNA